MKIIFSPEYAGTVYVKPKEGGDVMMDCVVVNTAGLVSLLELRLGIHCENEAAAVRVAHYYHAVAQYLEAHPENVMAASFQNAGLNTAQAMFSWREALRGAGWQFDGGEISQRLEALIGVEEIFRTTVTADWAERLLHVTRAVADQQLDCRELTIEIPVDKQLLKPRLQSLIDALLQQGAQLEVMAEATPETTNNLARVRRLLSSERPETIELDENDDSLQIWQFADERQACEYLAYHEMDDVDVWINADNKQMDNWLQVMNRPLTGSLSTNCTPQLTQLFVMGLSMFVQPLNVHALIEWLNMPVHPIERFPRTILADTIVREGGYRNDACRKVIDHYIAGKYVYLTDEEKALSEAEQIQLRKADSKKRKKLAGLFLPPLQPLYPLPTATLKEFVIELSSWARQRAHLMSNEAKYVQWVEQLLAVAGMCDACYILLDAVAGQTIDAATLDSWVSTIYQQGNFTHAVAECHCRTVVDAPAKIASPARSTVWIGVEGDASPARECAFLYPSERHGLNEQQYFTPWDEVSENAYHQQMMLTPLRMTQERLILVVRDSVNGESAPKHPLLVRLERQVRNLDAFVRKPFIPADERSLCEMVDNSGVDDHLKFDHADQIEWPDHLSPTTTGTLVEYPFDFLLGNLLDINHAGKAQMVDLKTTKGNVAHAVLERLLAPRGTKRHSSPQEIAERIATEYEQTYTAVLEAKGALLLLAENKLKEKLLHEQLRNCLDTLLEILTDNELKVTGCERFVEATLGLRLPQAKQKWDKECDRDMTGYIDLTLEDAEGHPVVFDFKWTTWRKGYQAMLKENRSVQLELYRWMLGQRLKDEVRRVAYFLMPEGRLYSKEAFKGRHCVQIDPDNADNIVEQLKRSVHYRVAQLKRGIVETNGNFGDLEYVCDTQKYELFPLKQNEEGMKSENRFTQYDLFLR